MRITRRKRIALSIILILVITVSAGVGAIAIAADVEDRSFGSLAVELIFRAALPGKSDRSEEKTNKLIADAGKKNDSFEVPDIYKTLYEFDTRYYMDTEVCFFGKEGADTVIYYLHGGAFVYQPTILHYRFCRLLAEELNARVIMPIYPKAPRHTYEYTLQTVYQIYDGIADGGANTVIMGDSAGGSLTLTLGQYIIEQGGDIPDDLVAISPCLDMTLENPLIPEYEKKDPMLSAKDLRMKFDVFFAGEADKESYTVSPIYCDYAALPQVTLIVGTHELFLPDARLLKKSLDEQGIAVNYFEYDKMIHTFPLFPIPEAKEALAQIKGILR